MSQKPLTYADAGVSIDAGNALVKAIGPLARSTARPGADAELGGFGGFFDLKAAGYSDPLLVAANDGVGTKLKLAIDAGRHDGVGIDLVAMCANDLVVQGAEPLFFLDYYATAKLDGVTAATVVASIAEGCRRAGCALIGGETAEMPGMYAEGEYDLAGFAVGVVEKSAIVDGRAIAPGDAVLGLASSGPHSNGYSLIRRIVADAHADLTAPLGEGTLADALMAPTRIYVKSLLALMRELPVKGMAHVTGGGITENVPRMLPAGTQAALDASRWPRPAVFDWLSTQGRVGRDEMLRVFNCGIGMAVVVAANDEARALSLLAAEGERAWRIGTIVARPDGAPAAVVA